MPVRRRRMHTHGAVEGAPYKAGGTAPNPTATSPQGRAIASRHRHGRAQRHGRRGRGPGRSRIGRRRRRLNHWHTWRAARRTGRGSQRRLGAGQRCGRCKRCRRWRQRRRRNSGHARRRGRSRQRHAHRRCLSRRRADAAVRRRSLRAELARLQVVHDISQRRGAATTESAGQENIRDGLHQWLTDVARLVSF
jgi:hypothetical protein